MSKNWTVGQKMTGGFGFILIMLALMIIWSVLSIGSIQNGIAGSAIQSELLQRELDHLNWANKVVSGIIDTSVTALDVQTDAKKCAFGKWYYGGARKHLEEMVPSIQKDLAAIDAWHHDLHASAIEIDQYIQQDEGRIKALAVYNDKTKLCLDKVQYYLGSIQAKVTAETLNNHQMLSQTALIRRAQIIVGTITIFIGIWMAGLITVGIKKALYACTDHLTQTSTQIAAVSDQVASSSQSLAESTTEQAAGLEETSASLEEMTAMTKQSAMNAKEANVLAEQARGAADSGTMAMEKMNEAINDIQASSSETAKIIKVIDEIAFQTNLLALNAAVEAARAGEAGKGFAVVADEVRNLAKRSAEAAKNTSALIEGSVNKAKAGVAISTEVGKVLGDIVGNVSKTSELVEEIAASAEEQSLGIEQINDAIAQMDQVTQLNASNAEESASASFELNNQSQKMNSIVNGLRALVSGADYAVDKPMDESADKPMDELMDESVGVDSNRISVPSMPVAKEQSPSEVIPFDDDMGDFNM